MHTCAPHGCELVFVPTIPRLQLRYSDEFSPLLETELPDGCVHTNAIMYFVRVCALHACDFVLAVVSVILAGRLGLMSFRWHGLLLA